MPDHLHYHYFDHSTSTWVPPGYRFAPTDDQLILHYLSNKVKGQPLLSEAVTDCEIYGDQDKEPWNIFDVTSPRTFYVFTKLKIKGKGKRIERTAGRGTWKGQRTDPVKDSDGNHIGLKKLFVFEVKGDGANNVNGHWLMHEYSLLTQSDYVLCAIRNKNANESTAEEVGLDHVEGIEAMMEEPEQCIGQDQTLMSKQVQATNTCINNQHTKRGLETEEDETQQKRMRFSNSVQDKQTCFTGAATPVSTLASDKSLGDQEGMTAEKLEQEWALEGFEDQNLDELLEATNAQEYPQQEEMMRFSDYCVMEDMYKQHSFTAAAEPALGIDSEFSYSNPQPYTLHDHCPHSLPDNSMGNWSD
ncbi:PREDICTED: NAC transcription factor 29 [Theobroma cacao]|uniref:NAC transcription factor 29 n=1 Tax=Theobroma cacao TaxID=3641 RepID=A0AB32UWJ8_THECC|nr:PREDICTED: NAC transcription factor 29 [Theobroma cacao]